MRFLGSDRLPRSVRRRGISLLEVLVSIFVLVVGILGLAALIPIGRFEVQEASKLDRGATIGREAHRQLLIRGYLDSDNWVIYRDNPSQEYVSYPEYVANLPSSLTAQQRSQVLIGPFAIDPLMLANRQNRDVVFGGDPAPSLVTFPYNANVDAAADNLSEVPELPRLSVADLMPDDFFNNLRINPTSLAYPQNEKDIALADYLFRGRDDLTFFLPDDKDARPVQQFSINGNGTTEVDFQTQTPNQRLSASSAGDFSWMVTVSPAQGSAYQWSTQQYRPQGMQQYVVSVVVFYKRPFTVFPNDPSESNPPAERTVMVEFSGSGIGGGSVHLESSDPRYLRDLRPNQWILLMGRVNVENVPPGFAPADMIPPPVIAKWYRIVAVDDGSEPTHRDVTLDGPDWPTDPNALWTLGQNLEGENITTTAAIFDGVVAVYDKTMQLDLTGN
jgi:hypothetical protein